MYRHNNRLRRVAALTLLLAVTSGAWADTKPATTNTETHKLCYCGCDAKPGSPMCLKMCELAKYKDRWWATSCDKKAASAPVQPAQQQPAHSRTRNGVQDARNN